MIIDGFDDAVRGEDGREPGADVVLSAAGAARREAMLGELIGAMEGVQRRRRLRRRASAVAGCAAVVVVVMSGYLYFGSARTGESGAGGMMQATNPAVMTILEVLPVDTAGAMVRTDAGVLERYRVVSGEAGDVESAGAGAYLTDEELVAVLAEIKRPAGLIRTAAGVFLTANVVDERPVEKAPDSPGSSEGSDSPQLQAPERVLAARAL